MSKLIIVIVLVLLMVVVTSGCRNIPNEGVEYHNNEANAPSEVLNEIILQSFSLEELGATVDIEKLELFKDPNTKYSGGYEVFTGSQFPLSCSRIPNTSILAINYCVHYSVGIDYMAALYLQGVYKPTDNDNRDYFIIIDEKKFSLSDLADRTIYSDAKIIVFDVTDFLSIDSFDKRIKTESLQWDNYSPQWMVEVYNYLKTYKDITIIYNNN